jgi:transposase
MYAVIKSFKNQNGTVRKYLCIVKSVREGARVRQKHIATLGRIDDLRDREEVEKLAKKLLGFLGKMFPENGVKVENVEWSKKYGLSFIGEAIWNMLGIGDILSKHINGRPKIIEAIKAMVLRCLEGGGSDLSTHRWIGGVYNERWEQLGLNYQDFYRGVDELAEHKESIEKELHENIRDLFGVKVDLVMFDTTSISYFGDGEGGGEEFITFGYNRDGIKGVKQVVLGVIMDRSGIPIGHEVWRGNMADCKAMEDILWKVKRRFNLGRIIWVCDRGMINGNVLRSLEESGYEYIAGVKMRKLSEDLKVQLLNLSGFEVVNSRLQVKEKWIGDTRYIVCYNPVQAEEDRIKREAFKKHLERNVKERSLKDWIIKNGYKSYVMIEGGQMVINYGKLYRESVFDGKWVLVTNTELPAREVGLYYKGLHKIEDGFRVLKSQIEIGPLYHWKERRIRGHIMGCFLAFVIRSVIEKKLAQNGTVLSWNRILESLNKICAVKLVYGDKKVSILRTNLDETAHKIFHALGIKIPPRILQK